MEKIKIEDCFYLRKISDETFIKLLSDTELDAEQIFKLADRCRFLNNIDNRPGSRSNYRTNYHSSRSVFYTNEKDDLVKIFKDVELTKNFCNLLGKEDLLLFTEEGAEKIYIRNESKRELLRIAELDMNGEDADSFIYNTYIPFISKLLTNNVAQKNKDGHQEFMEQVDADHFLHPLCLEDERRSNFFSLHTRYYENEFKPESTLFANGYYYCDSMLVFDVTKDKQVITGAIKDFISKRTEKEGKIMFEIFLLSKTGVSDLEKNSESEEQLYSIPTGIDEMKNKYGIGGKSKIDVLTNAFRSRSSLKMLNDWNGRRILFTREGTYTNKLYHRLTSAEIEGILLHCSVFYEDCGHKYAIITEEESDSFLNSIISYFEANKTKHSNNEFYMYLIDEKGGRF